ARVEAALRGPLALGLGGGEQLDVARARLDARHGRDEVRDRVLGVSRDERGGLLAQLLGRRRPSKAVAVAAEAEEERVRLQRLSNGEGRRHADGGELDELTQDGGLRDDVQVRYEAQR